MTRITIGFALLAFLSTACAQQPPPPRPDDVGFGNGTVSLSAAGFNLKFIKDSQTLVSLCPQFDAQFDFLPSDRQSERNSNGFYQFGDLNLRIRKGKETDWHAYSSASQRKPVTVLSDASTLAKSDMAPTFPADFPLRVVRAWRMEKGRLALSFSITNPTQESIEIGALGIPLILNNIISGRSLKDAHERCVFSDPYIGEDAGYVQATRLSGQGPALIVAPLSGSPLEAYRLLPEPTRPNQTFEGMFEWMVNTRAYAENEWKAANQWNVPTSTFLKPGETKVVGVRFLLSDTIRNIEKTLAANNRPVAVGVPGYILPKDQEGKLFLKYASSVRKLTVEPSGAMSISQAADAKDGYKTLKVRANGWGRARLTVTYADGTRQTIHYYLTKPAAQVARDMGYFLSTKQWFTDANDPFHRAPSFISYDREANQQVVQDSRVWIAGLGDEGGSGSFVAEAMKLFGQPNKEEVEKFEQFVDGVLWDNIQFKDGPNKFGVRKSTFFYEPALVPGFTYDAKRNWTSWTSWNKKSSEDIGRGYNYPHVVASYWSMYRIARNHPGLATHHDWQWYLNQAYETTAFMTSDGEGGNPRVWYVDLGLMEGTIFIKLLDDLKREGWTDKANLIEARMKARADRWISQEYPFGSEMAWDSTGQEEVYGWCKYFGQNSKAIVSLNSIIGYMPTLPHWGYNGNARRYWDFLYGGKLSRIERQLHHYGSGLNAIPMLNEYRENPDDFYLLRAGYGGAMGALSNIDQEGCASVAFHSFPSTLKWDAYTGDYGPNFFGHAMNAGTYVVDHPDFGWLAFGGDIKANETSVTVKPQDTFRRQVYVAPLGLWLTLDAGTFDSVEIDLKTKSVKLGIVGDRYTPIARLIIGQPCHITGIGKYGPDGKYAEDAGAWSVPLKNGTNWVTLTPGLWSK